MVINTQEECVYENGNHNEVLKSLRLNSSEALQSEAINRLYWYDLWVRVYKKSLNLYPFFLFVREVITTLSFFDLLVELVNNNRNKQVHDEEGDRGS